MSIAKRRKVEARTPAPTNRGIAAFTRVSKAQVISKDVFAKNAVLEEGATIKITAEGLKRKIDSVDEIEVEKLAEQVPAYSPPRRTSTRTIKPLPQRRLVSKTSPKTPHNPILPPSPATETPTRGARTLLDKLFLQSQDSTPSSSPSSSQTSKFTDIDSSQTTVDSELANSIVELPIELIDLINLHSAFLTALTLHYAHNGTHTPADLRLLCPNIARAWGKRKVLLEDIRRILGVLDITSTPEAEIPTTNSTSTIRAPLTAPELSLSDYGYGKICIEIRIPGARSKIARPLNENLLNDTFTHNLRNLYNQHEFSTITNFLASLPLAPIVTCPSLTKMSPLLAKGQRRLEDLRHGIIVKKALDAEKASLLKTVTSTSASASSPGDTTTPRLTLLERLRAKSALRASAPAPPSPAQTARAAALSRLPEVISVLTLLSTSSSLGQARVSFTMPTVTGKLRDSFRTPLSGEEAEMCVRLLAEEIAPEWMRVVRMGRVEALVVSREGRVDDVKVGERIRVAGTKVEG
jgi:hypothetical protein